ncbi:MAG: hypothetical protein R3Y19_07370 [Rikenellaceae bacterium]
MADVRSIGFSICHYVIDMECSRTAVGVARATLVVRGSRVGSVRPAEFPYGNSRYHN